MLYFFPISKEPFLYPFKEDAGLRKSPLLLLATEQKQYQLARAFKESGELIWKDLEGNQIDPGQYDVWSPLGDYRKAEDKHPAAELAPGELLDEDGYPTEFALWSIQSFDYSNPAGFFDLIEKIWYMKSFGFHREPLVDDANGKTNIGEKVFLSTAGWSGNESVIQAMQNNLILWQTTWKVSRIGGHYEFEYKHEDA